MTVTVWTCGAPERATTRCAAPAIVASCVTTTMVTWTGHHGRLFARALDMASDLHREGVTPDARGPRSLMGYVSPGRTSATRDGTDRRAHPRSRWRCDAGAV